KHACEDGAVVVLDGLADLPEPERAESTAMLLALADLAAYLSDANFAHAFASPSGEPPGSPEPFPWSASRTGGCAASPSLVSRWASGASAASAAGSADSSSAASGC